MSFGRVYMRIFDAHIHALLLNTIYMGTKHAYIYIWVQNKHIYTYKTRIYLRTKRAYTSELFVLLALAVCLNEFRRTGESGGGLAQI